MSDIKLIINPTETKLLAQCNLDIHDRVVDIIKERGRANILLARGRSTQFFHSALSLCAMYYTDKTVKMIDFSKIHLYYVSEFIFDQGNMNSTEYATLLNNMSQDPFLINASGTLNFPPENCHLFDVTIPFVDMEEYIKEYRRSILLAGGIDLAVLGVGANGRVGFNEPGSNIDSSAKIVHLNEKTQKELNHYGDLASFDIKHSFTLGIPDILSCREIFVFALAAEKKEAIRQLIFEEPTSRWPISWLRYHSNVTVITSDQALGFEINSNDVTIAELKEHLAADETVRSRRASLSKFQSNQGKIIPVAVPLPSQPSEYVAVKNIDLSKRNTSFSPTELMSTSYSKLDQFLVN
eukprot:TRINITY_DN1075_c0_g1_i1.p1 TRINITY_DN1075_c0_g1~~TRINITY_DN1075_c0_g1_i1.p1  ORF type:complete len:352 (+),score=83.55 TRINITY_DN1075_c0_g1_i1:203-1258(+)